MTKQTIFHILRSAEKRTGFKNLCLAGGVAQNSVANGKIKANTSFENIYIPSAGHDAGISMGAALYVHNQLLKKERMPAINSAYTGSHFTNEEIRQFLCSKELRFCEPEDAVLFDKVYQHYFFGYFSAHSCISF